MACQARQRIHDLEEKLALASSSEGILFRAELEKQEDALGKIIASCEVPLVI